MCIAVFSWQAHPLYPFILLQNRDEYHSRPTEPLGWWDGGEILGGRDKVAGGTWLACSRRGRIAFVTNVMEPNSIPEANSRGNLPLLFLQSRKSPKEFAEELKEDAHTFNGFNLIVADMLSNLMVYVTNRPKCGPLIIQEVSPGIHALSNAKLDSPWHKAQRLRVIFKEHIARHVESDIHLREMIEKLMRDRLEAEKQELPGICASDWELALSPIFVEVKTPLGVYGTRNISAVAVTMNKEVKFYETSLEDGAWRDKMVKYTIHKEDGLR